MFSDLQNENLVISDSEIGKQKELDVNKKKSRETKNDVNKHNLNYDQTNNDAQKPKPKKVSKEQKEQTLLDLFDSFISDEKIENSSEVSTLDEE